LNETGPEFFGRTGHLAPKKKITPKHHQSTFDRHVRSLYDRGQASHGAMVVLCQEIAGEQNNHFGSHFEADMFA